MYILARCQVTLTKMMGEIDVNGDGVIDACRNLVLCHHNWYPYMRVRRRRVETVEVSSNCAIRMRIESYIPC